MRKGKKKIEIPNSHDFLPHITKGHWPLAIPKGTTQTKLGALILPSLFVILFLIRSLPLSKHCSANGELGTALPLHVNLHLTLILSHFLSASSFSLNLQIPIVSYVESHFPFNPISQVADLSVLILSLQIIFLLKSSL